MERTITVKGTGRASAAPDTTEISMTVRGCAVEYEKAMNTAYNMVGGLHAAVQSIGFAEDDIKTESFNVNTEYESVCDKNGNYKTVFKGYACTMRLRMEFPFDTERLSEVLAAISGCIAEPELSVRFTVADKKALSDSLLRDAAVNAREKAKILCESSGVKLGRIISIKYDFDGFSAYSATDFAVEAKCMAMPAGNMRFTPEDISLTDTVGFVWEIE